MKKSAKGYSVKMDLLLEFERAFPGETPLSVDEYLSGGSKSLILNAAALFLGFKSYNSKFSDNDEFLNMFFRKENFTLANYIRSRIRDLILIWKKETGLDIQIRIINQYTSLKLFEHYFSKPEQPETQTKDEFERNLFKAYLILNSEATKAQDVALVSTDDLDYSMQIPLRLFSLQYPFADKTNYDIVSIWATQFIKSIYLFQYLEQTPKTQNLLAAFVSHFNKPNWREYLKTLLNLTKPLLERKYEAHIDIEVPTNESFEEVCNFIEKLCVNEDEELDTDDFKSLRSTPFYKIRDGIYRVIFDLFVVEKIFKGVYFLLREVNESLPPEDKIAGLKSVYCYEFSEKTLMYRVINDIYPEQFIKFTGQHLSDLKIDGAPDYYLRKGNKILLIESKDFLIRADLKASFNFNIYEEEFGKTLYYQKLTNGKEKSGAVMQLINSIEKLLQNNFSPDKDYHYKDVYIYPVLITHDHQYDVPGFNNMLNYWLEDELQTLSKKGLFIHHIKPLTSINIDSLLYHKTTLNSNANLFNVLDAYHKRIKINPKEKYNSLKEAEKKGTEKFLPFSQFIDNYIRDLDLTSIPPFINEVLPVLFPEEYESKLDS